MREPKDSGYGAYQELNIHLSRIQDLEKKVAEQGQAISSLQFLNTILIVIFLVAPTLYKVINFILEATRP